MERLSRNFPSSIPQVIDNILGKICFTEQVVYRKQSLGAPVLCLILNRLLLSCNSSRLYVFIYFFVMEFGIQKCACIILKRGKTISIDVIIPEKFLHWNRERNTSIWAVICGRDQCCLFYVYSLVKNHVLHGGDKAPAEFNGQQILSSLGVRVLANGPLQVQGEFIPIHLSVFIHVMAFRARLVSSHL